MSVHQRVLSVALGAALACTGAGVAVGLVVADTRTTLAAAPAMAAAPVPVVVRAAPALRLQVTVPPKRPAIHVVLPRPPAPHRPAQPSRSAVRRTAPVVSAARFDTAEAAHRGQAAYVSLGRRLPPTWTLRFEVYNGVYAGFADGPAKVVTIWVRPTDSQAKLRIVLAHELGHVLDYTTLSKRGRVTYLALRQRGGSRAPWYPANGTTDFASPAGDFAEVYALYRAGGGDFRSTFAPQPNAAQLSALASFFAGLEAQQP